MTSLQIMAKDQVTVFDAGFNQRSYLSAAWQHRDLLWFFARRDLVIRYRQTLLGVAWVLIRPILAMGIFTFLFSTVANLNSHGLPYPLLILVGMMPWQYFSSVLNEGTGSLVNNRALVTKVYFPRIIMPASGLVLNTADLLVNLVFLAVVMVWYGVAPGWQVVLAPISFVLMAGAALGAALWFSALAVRYRDVRAIVPVILQFGILTTPVAFTVAALPEEWRWYAWLNPLAGPVEWLRWCLLPGTVMPGPKAMALSCAATAFLLISGYAFFRRAESKFADVI